MITGNEPAMPEIITEAEYKANSVYGNTYSYGGLTIRQHFAAMFTAAYISCPANGNPIDCEGNAAHGVRQADALIDALNK